MSEPFSARAKSGHVKVPAHPAQDAHGAAEAPFVYLGRQPILDLLNSSTLKPELLVGPDGARAIAQARAAAMETAG